MLASIIPPEAGDWAHRPYLRWQLADEVADAQGGTTPIRAWHVCAGLKAGLTLGQWMDQVADLVRRALPSHAVADLAGHLPTSKRAHAHILVAPRRAGSRSYGEIDFSLYHRLNTDLRRSWEHWLLS